MDIDTKEKVSEIRRLNDEFRTTFRGGKILFTASVAALPNMVKASALEKVAEFKDFNEANDPNGEHDFLKFEHCNREFIFSIVYYDKTLEWGSEDPADPNQTVRVGTLMLAADW